MVANKTLQALGLEF